MNQSCSSTSYHVPATGDRKDNEKEGEARSAWQYQLVFTGSNRTFNDRTKPISGSVDIGIDSSLDLSN